MAHILGWTVFALDEQVFNQYLYAQQALFGQFNGPFRWVSRARSALAVWRRGDAQSEMFV